MTHAGSDAKPVSAIYDELSFESVPEEVKKYMQEKVPGPVVRCLRNNRLHHIIVTVRKKNFDESITFLECSDGWVPIHGHIQGSMFYRNNEKA
jgi:hypothetical protein